MSTNAETVFSAILTKLRLPDATGSYTYDLTDTDRVIVGDYVDPQTLPQVMVQPRTVREKPGPDLTSMECSITVDAVGFVGSAADTPESRLFAAWDLAADLTRALRTDRSLGNLTIDISPEVTDAVALETESGELYGVCLVTITARWLEDA